MAALMNGTATFNAGEQSNSLLCESNGYAATSLTGGGTWQVRVSRENREQFTLSYEGDESKTLTLATEDSGNPHEVPIVTKPMQNPPHPTQLWTMEECIGPMIFPPMMQGRLQSCARPDLSAAVGGSAPLQRTHMGISGVPNEQARENRDAGLWHVRYREVS